MGQWLAGVRRTHFLSLITRRKRDWGVGEWRREDSKREIVMGKFPAALRTNCIVVLERINATTLHSTEILGRIKYTFTEGNDV